MGKDMFLYSVFTFIGENLDSYQCIVNCFGTQSFYFDMPSTLIVLGDFDYAIVMGNDASQYVFTDGWHIFKSGHQISIAV